MIIREVFDGGSSRFIWSMRGSEVRYDLAIFIQRIHFPKSEDIILGSCLFDSCDPQFIFLDLRFICALSHRSLKPFITCFPFPIFGDAEIFLLRDIDDVTYPVGILQPFSVGRYDNVDWIYRFEFYTFAGYIPCYLHYALGSFQEQINDDWELLPEVTLSSYLVVKPMRSHSCHCSSTIPARYK